MRFNASSASLQLLYPDGLSEEHTISRLALRQYASRILPSYGLKTVDALRVLTSGGANGEAQPLGAQLTCAMWALFARDYTNPLKFRTVRRGVSPHIRAVLSQTYPTYDNLEFLEDMLFGLGKAVNDYAVISCRLDSDALRLRMVGDVEGWKTKEVDQPFPMIEAWNSEVGQRSVNIHSGTYTLWCSNGCGHWSDDGRWRWIHSGRTSQRIKEGVAGAMTEALVKGSEVANAYDQALQIAVGNAFAWFEDAITHENLADRQIESVRAALTGEPTVLHHGGTVASIIDAVTFAAQREPTLVGQEGMEMLGGRLLRRVLVPA